MFSQCGLKHQKHAIHMCKRACMNVTGRAAGKG